MMLIDSLDDDVEQLRDENTWNTIQDQNEGNENRIEQNNWMNNEQKSNKDK